MIVITVTPSQPVFKYTEAWEHAFFYEFIIYSWNMTRMHEPVLFELRQCGCMFNNGFCRLMSAGSSDDLFMISWKAKQAGDISFMEPLGSKALKCFNFHKSVRYPFMK